MNRSKEKCVERKKEAAPPLNSALSKSPKYSPMKKSKKGSRSNSRKEIKPKYKVLFSDEAERAKRCIEMLANPFHGHTNIEKNNGRRKRI